MRMILKIMALLALALTVSACAVSPGKPVERTGGCSKLDPALCGERVTLADKQGTSTLKVVRKNGMTLDASWVDKPSTAEQDMALTAIGAATGPLINGVTANMIANKNNCGDGGCGGSQQTVVQVDTSSASSSQSGGCASGNCGRKKLPSSF